MKKFLLITVCLFIAFTGSARTHYMNDKYTTPKFSLGLGSGVNSYTSALGISGNVKLVDRFFLQGGLGIGGWGKKYSIGLRYDMRKGNGWSYGLGYSECMGLNSFNLTINENSVVTKQTLRLHETGCINIKASYNWMISKSNLLYLDLGYAFPMKNDPWTLKSGPSLSETAITTLNLLAPGGMILGIGITLGL